MSTHAAPSDARARVPAAVLLIVTAILWSTGGLLVKMLDWHPIAIWAGRGALAFLVFLAYLRRLPRTWPSRWQYAAIACLIGTQLLFVAANKLTTAANTIFLQYIAPVYIVFFAYWFLHERPQRIDWITMVFILAGLVLIFGEELTLGAAGSTGGRMVGNILALVSGITMAGMNVAMRGQDNPAESIMLGYLITGAVGMPALLRETFTLQAVAIIAFLGFIQVGLAYIVFAIAIRRVPAMEATLILTLEPVLNPLWVFLVLGERPGPRAMAGGIVVIGAVTLRALVSARARERSREPACSV